MKYAIHNGVKVLNVVRGLTKIEGGLSIIAMLDDWEGACIGQDILNGSLVPIEPEVYVPPTNEEIYDQQMLTNRVVKALALALNDGSFVPGSNYTNPEIKAIIKDKM